MDDELAKVRRDREEARPRMEQLSLQAERDGVASGTELLHAAQHMQEISRRYLRLVAASAE